MSTINQGALNRIDKGINNGFQPVVFHHGKNLFNKKNVIVDTALNIATGVEYSASGYSTTYKIPVIPFSKIYTNKDLSRILFYKDGVYIPDKAINNPAIGVIEIPDCNSFRITFSNAYSDVLQLEYGESSTAYESFDPTPRLPNIGGRVNVNIENREINTVYKSDIIKRLGIKFMSGVRIEPLTGMYAYASLSVSTPLIPVSPGRVYQRGNDAAGNDSYNRILYFDKDEQFIGSNVTIEGTSNAEKVFKTPGNCHYIATTLRNNTLDVVDSFFLKEIELKDTEDAFIGIKDNTDKLLRAINMNIDRGKFIYNKLTYNGVSFENSEGSIFSGLIPVEPSTAYVKGRRSTNSSTSRLWLYDYAERKIGEVSENYFETPENCKYVAIMVKHTTLWDYSKDRYLIIKYDDYLKEPIGEVVRDNDLYRASIIGNGVMSDYRIAAMFENHCIFYHYSTPYPGFYYSQSGFDFKRAKFIEFSEDNFPGLIADFVRMRFVIFNTSNGLRAMFFNNKNQVYYSTDSTFTNWKQSNIWGLYGKKTHYLADDNDKDPSGTRWRVREPLNLSERSAFYTWLNGLVRVEGLGGQLGLGLLFAAYGDCLGDTGSPARLYYTEDGENVYVQYEFGISSGYIKGGSTNVLYHTDICYGSPLDTSNIIGNYTGGLGLKVRYNIIPSEADKEPVDIFSYGDAVAITAFSKANGAVATVADATEINIGDTVVITGDSGNTDWNRYVNNTADSKTGGNGVMFKVRSKSGNNLTLYDVIGNPDNNIFCRHIHVCTEFGNGIVLGTGELYPQSWLVYIQPYTGRTPADYNNMNKDLWRDSVFRLNSSENGLQRTLGLYLTSNNDVLWASDEPAIYTTLAQIRGRDFVSNSFGIWKFKISDIDDRNKSKLMLPAVNALYQLRRIGSVLLCSDYYGVTYISRDEGETWEYVCTGGGSKTVITGFDKSRTRFYLGEFIIEFK